MSALTHIVGPPVEIDGHLRQRCAWCGAVLDDVELAGVVSIETGEEPRPYPTWPEGAQLRVDGGLRAVVQESEIEQDTAADLAPDSCARLPFELTGTPTEVVDR